MKKSVLFGAIVATTIIMSTERAIAQKGLLIGTEGTPQMSWIMNQDDQDNDKFEFKNTLSASFGISGQYGFTQNLGIGLNALYSFQGQQFKLNGIERIKKVEYLKIPLMFTYNYEFNSVVKFIGKIGPQLDLLTNARLTDVDGNNIVGNHKEAYEDFDIAGVISLGAGYKIADNLFLDTSVRFDYAFTDAENKDYNKNINNPGELIFTNGYSYPVNNRKIANNMTSGLTVGIRYLISTNNAAK